MATECTVIQKIVGKFMDNTEILAEKAELHAWFKDQTDPYLTQAPSRQKQ